MAAVFSLVLEFFLLAQVENARDLKTERQYMTAQIMYTLAKQRRGKSVKFDNGIVSTTDNIVYNVEFSSGEKYTFGD